MEYQRLGDTGLKVSPMCLGTMMLGSMGNKDRAEGVRMIHTALDKGLNFVDTANVYSAGESEEIVGEALKDRRHDVVLATKVRAPMGKGPNDSGLSRGHILRQVEESLRRLKTDYIDLYQIHRPDADTPIEETLRTLDDLIQSGKVRHVGCSTGETSGNSGMFFEIVMPAWQMIDFVWTSRTNGWEPFRCVQPIHSLLDRGLERDLIPAAAAHGMGVITYSPLSNGWLTGKYRKGHEMPADSRGARRPGPRFDVDHPMNARRGEVVEELIPVATELGISLSQLALAWSMKQPGITAPIIGPRTPAQLEDNLGALDVSLSDELLKKIDGLVPSGTSV